MNIDNGKDTYEKHELIHREPVDGTPFQVISVEDGSFIAMGRFRISEMMPEEKCMEMIEKRDWNLILASISVILSHLKTEA